MGFRYPTLSARFFIALFVLLASLAGLGAVSAFELGEVNAANDQVYLDNYRTAEITTSLSVELGRAESLSLRIVSAGDATTATELRTELDQVTIPKVNTLIQQFKEIHADDPPDELAAISRITPDWRAFLDLRERGGLARLSATQGAPRSSDARQVSETLDPLVSFVAGCNRSSPTRRRRPTPKPATPSTAASSGCCSQA
jgi:hypothetical protein